VHTTITTTSDSLTVAPADVSILGQDFRLDRLATAPAMAGLAQRLVPRTVALPELPGGVRLTGARASEAGLVLTAALPRSDKNSYKSNDCS
jgi:hypothetical protein